VYGRKLRCSGDVLGTFRNRIRRRAEGLELGLARRWNERVSHYDGSETDERIRNVQKGKY